MDKIEELVEKIYESNKIITLDEIIKLNLNEEEFSNLIKALKKLNIYIKNEDSEELEDLDDLGFSEDIVKQYLNEIGKYKSLTPEEEKESFEQYKQTHNPEIRQKVINSNLRFVVMIAKRYTKRHKSSAVDFLDLVQEGNKGLIKAFEKYDVSLGYRFETYAAWWIKQGVSRFLSDTSRTIRVPSYLLLIYSRINKYIEIKKLETGAEVSNLEIAEVFDLEEEYVKYIRNLLDAPVISLNEKIGESDDNEIMDFLPSYEPLTEEIIEKKMCAEKLKVVINNVLNEREAIVISCRYGIINKYNDIPRERTLEEVGQIFGITRERVRQIEAKALRKLRMNKKKIV